MFNLKRLVTVQLFCFLTIYSLGQDQVRNYVQQSTQQIRTIHPDSTDFSDLEIIGRAIGDARIILLGEQDHGDAPTFLAKTRLIKYLHDQKGFNVLAFEADFFSINYNWPLVLNGKMKAEDVVNNNITSFWTKCSACFPLFKEYLPNSIETNSPLMLAGIDNQMGTHYLLPKLDSMMQEWKLPITTLSAYKSEILPLLNDWHRYTEDSLRTDSIIAIYKEIKQQMISKVSPGDFWVQVVENLIQQNLQFRNWKKDYWKDINTRDKAMAANIKWLAEEKYPNEKIIVWAHNYHVSKYAGHYPESFLNNAFTMGSVLTRDTSFLRQTYALGFTSLKGKAGRLFTKTYNLEKAKSNSFERWINPAFAYAFTDFRQYNSSSTTANEIFLMSGSIKGRHHESHEAQWNRVFDGVFYIRDMYPCER